MRKHPNSIEAGQRVGHQRVKPLLVESLTNGGSVFEASCAREVILSRRIHWTAYPGKHWRSPALGPAAGLGFWRTGSGSFPIPGGYFDPKSSIHLICTRSHLQQRTACETSVLTSSRANLGFGDPGAGCCVMGTNLTGRTAIAPIARLLWMGHRSSPSETPFLQQLGATTWNPTEYRHGSCSQCGSEGREGREGGPSRLHLAWKGDPLSQCC